MTGLKFYFRNDEAWTIDCRFIGGLWIKYVTISFGRIHGSEFVEIHPCEGFRTEIFQEGDYVQTRDINLSSLELGMSSRALKCENIGHMEILYRNGTSDLVYFPCKDRADEDLNNIYQSTEVSERTKNLYIIIDPAQAVDGVYVKELE